MKLKVSQVADVRLGRQRAPQYEAGEYQTPYLRSANIDPNGINLDDVKSMNFDPTEREIFGLAPGDVLLTEGSGSRSAVGQPAVWAGQLDGVVCFQNTVLRLRPREGLMDGRYLAWWARHAHASGQMAEAASGANILHLGSDGLKRLDLFVPGLIEQRRIADFLDDRVSRIDNIIAARRRQADASPSIVTAMIENLIVDRDMASVRASRVLRVLPGFAFPGSEFSTEPNGVRLLRGTNVGVGSCRWHDVVYWPRDKIEGLEEFVLHAGDVVLGMDRPWIAAGLRIAQLTESDMPALLLQRVAKLVPGTGLRARYAYWIYRANRFQDAVESDLTGLSVPHLSGDQIASARIPMGSLDVQDEIVAELDRANEDHISALRDLEKSINLLTEYKQSLITAAVTGELDVTTAATRVPA